ncbi:MAG: transcription termination factor Rho [Planctomycetes bacterium]|nr:transcription termination factor Rho [Planctomycetota bacterium]
MSDDAFYPRTARGDGHDPATVTGREPGRRRRRGHRRRRRPLGDGAQDGRSDRDADGDDGQDREAFRHDPRLAPRHDGGRNGASPAVEEEEAVSGCLFVVKDGFGFLRQARLNYLSGPGDVFVPAGVIQRYRLRSGQFIEGRLGRGKRGKKRRPLEVVDRVDGDPPEVASRRPGFKSLTSVDPTRRINLEGRDNDPTLRVIDLVTPIGFGQRMLIVAPPRVGKTVILHKIANAIGQNHPDAHVIVLLVDERPEEVTDFRRTCTHAEVIASSLDMDPSAHVAVVEVVMDRVRRLAEAGKDVVCLMDSLTRMSRAFNTERGRSGRTLTGGMDSTAMQKPREFFGSARAFEGGGSITNIATVLVDTGSKMDQVIFEEFKGTGNCELVLNRELADLRVFPAINVKDSGTRKEEKLRDPQELQLINLLRRGMLRFGAQRSMEGLVSRVKTTSSNAELLLMLQKQAI